MQRIRLRNVVDRQHRRSGAATVEMAFAAPVLFTLVFGIMQVGYAFMVQHGLQNAANKGCRAGTLPTRSTASITSAAQSTLQQMGIANYASITIQVNNATADVSTASTGDYVTVKVAVPVSSVTLFPGFFSNWTGTIVGADTNRCQ